MKFWEVAAYFGFLLVFCWGVVIPMIETINRRKGGYDGKKLEQFMESFRRETNERLDQLRQETSDRLDQLSLEAAEANRRLASIEKLLKEVE